MENFADKWNTKPGRVGAFFEWIRQATADLTGENLYNLNRLELSENIKRCFGENTGRTVFSKAAEECRTGVKNGSLKVDTSSGNLSQNGNVLVPTNKHYGE